MGGFCATWQKVFTENAKQLIKIIALFVESVFIYICLALQFAE
jgi:hypothetical protein